jgi:hypothetical protein
MVYLSNIITGLDPVLYGFGNPLVPHPHLAKAFAAQYIVHISPDIPQQMLHHPSRTHLIPTSEIPFSPFPSERSFSFHSERSEESAF